MLLTTIQENADATDSYKMPLLHLCTSQRLIAEQHALLEVMTSLADEVACSATITVLRGYRKVQPCQAL